jgi:hypothetical protein
LVNFGVAFIAPHDYETFRILARPHLPDTYEQWLDYHRNKCEDIVGNGHSYEEVQIDPDDFRQYFATHQEKLDIGLIDLVAIWKRGRTNRA